MRDPSSASSERIENGGPDSASKTEEARPGLAHCDIGQSWHEMNMWFDPHAARKVLRAVPYVTGNWSRVVALPSDVASQPEWRPELQAAIRELQHQSTLGEYIVNFTLNSGQNVAFPLFDELSAVFWAAGMPSEMITGSKLLDIDVSIGEVSAGALLTWPPGLGPGLGEQRATLLLGDVNLDVFEAQLLALIRN